VKGGSSQKSMACVRIAQRAGTRTSGRRDMVGLKNKRSILRLIGRVPRGLRGGPRNRDTASTSSHRGGRMNTSPLGIPIRKGPDLQELQLNISPGACQIAATEVNRRTSLLRRSEVCGRLFFLMTQEGSSETERTPKGACHKGRSARQGGRNLKHQDDVW